MEIIKSWEPLLIGADPMAKELILAKLKRFIHTNVGLSYPAV